MTTAPIAKLFETMEYGPAPEGAGPAEHWLEAHRRSFGPFIHGQLYCAEELDVESFATCNPATSEELGQVAQCGRMQVNAAVAAARQAQPGWWKLGGHGRARYLYAIARHIQKNSRLLAMLETLDNGKPIRETRDLDVPLAARHFYHHAGWSQLMATELADQVPLGVAGQIIPWNFPLLMLAWKIAPAIAMGNTVVLKPAEFTNLSAIAFAEICQQVGLPPGVVNLLTGDGRTGELLVNHPDINKIAFTGSTEVGRIIRRATAGSGKKLSLELGGKSPFTVFDDADLDSAVEGVVDAIWFNQGEVCCAGSRLLVQEGVAEPFYAKLRARMEKLRVGDPTDKAIDIGAIVAPVQLDTIRNLVQQGVDEGATLWQPSCKLPESGCFYPPTLFTDVAPAATIAQVEIFGPVLVSMTFRTPAEAVQLANNTRYGLAASVWTENINLAHDVAAQIKAGTVWINSTNLFDAAAGFGGYRESGYGREGGREGLFEYLQPSWEAKAKASQKEGEHRANDSTTRATSPVPAPASGPRTIDRTAKMYVGGKQARPDGGYSRPVVNPQGQLVGEAGEGNRKDIRNAVAAARKAAGWGGQNGHLKAQILYYVGENLAARRDEFARRLLTMTGAKKRAAEREVDLSVERLFHWAAWADKYDGRIHSTPIRNFTLAVPEPIGTLAILCPDEAPLLAFVSAVFAAVAMGNTVVAVPSQRHPLAVTDLYQVLDTSDLPGGVVNIVTGERELLAGVLADHAGIDALWYFGSAEGSAAVERASADNLKQTWVNHGYARNWLDPIQGAGQDFLRHATQIKNVWVPYGE